MWHLIFNDKKKQNQSIQISILNAIIYIHHLLLMREFPFVFFQYIMAALNYSIIYDFVFAKRVLTYWENRGNRGNSHMNVFIIHGNLYIFGKVGFSPLQKYIVFHSYNKDIHVAVVKISPILPKFSSTLVPFSLIRNHTIIMHYFVCWNSWCSNW